MGGTTQERLRKHSFNFGKRSAKFTNVQCRSRLGPERQRRRQFSLCLELRKKIADLASQTHTARGGT